MRSERQVWLSTQAYRRLVEAARRDARKDPEHRKVLKQVRSAIRRSQEAMAKDHRYY
jgi:hypothetical protein